MHLSYSEQNNKLRTHLEKFNKDILAQKESTFLQDKRAVQDGKAYKWQQRQDIWKKQPNPSHMNVYSNVSDNSSISSFLSLSSSKQFLKN